MTINVNTNTIKPNTYNMIKYWHGNSILYKSTLIYALSYEPHPLLGAINGSITFDI